MVVDDSEVVLELTRSVLEGAGYRVLTRNRPAGCIAAMLRENPDLVLVDVSMPGVGGDTLVRCFGTAHPTSKTIVLLYSSLPEEALQLKAEASGAHGYIQKTHDAAVLLRQVRRWVDPSVVQSGTFNALAKPATRSGESAFSMSVPSGGPSSGPATSTRQLIAGRVLLVDSDMVMLSEYRGHLSGQGLRLEFALSGRHALELMSSSDGPDAAVIALDLGDVPGEVVHEKMVDEDPSWRERLVLVIQPGQEQRVPYFSRKVLKRPIDGAALRTIIQQCLSVSDLEHASG
jgi:CheY-like chemotaxis protein